MRKFAIMSALASAALAVPGVMASAVLPEPGFDGFGGSRPSRVRGKHKPRRHGQTLKSCRVKIGRRVRRKHRRAVK